MANTTAKVLQRLPLFAGLSGHDREFLARYLDEVDLPAGETLIREGQSNGAFWVLVEGEVEVTVAGEPRRCSMPKSLAARKPTLPSCSPRRRRGMRPKPACRLLAALRWHANSASNANGANAA